MIWSVWLVVGLAFLLVAWRVFSSKPDRTESDAEKLEREHDSGLLTDVEYLHKKAMLPH
jgi:hypothetical protein